MKHALILTLCLALHAAPAADLSVKAAPASATTAPAFISCPPSGTSDIRWFYLSNNPTARRDVGQVITPIVSSPVQRLALEIADHDKAVGVGAPGAAVTLRWYAYEGIDSLGTSQPLAEVSGHLPSSLDPGERLTFTFPAISLQAGRSYAVILSFQEAGANQFVNFAAAPARNYPDGQALFFTTTATDPDLHYEEFSANLVFDLLTD